MAAIFPEVLDSTMLSAMKCWQLFFREYVEGWRPKVASVHLHAGGAFAKGIEASRRAFYEQGASAESAIAAGLGVLINTYGDFECPPDSAKSLERMAGAFEFYWDHYPLGRDGTDPITLPSGKRGIEISFCEPLPIDHPETGNPLLFAGRLDMAASYAGGTYIVDEKTTASLGASWSKQWDLRAQFRAYRWGLRKAAGVAALGTIVRGVAILKTKFDTQTAITYCSDVQESEWFETTCDLVEQAVQRFHDRQRSWIKNGMHSGACSEYGDCVMRQPCLSPDPQPWLEQYFEVRRWNPLLRG